MLFTEKQKHKLLESGFSRQIIYNWEQGDMPSGYNLLKIIKILDLSDKDIERMLAHKTVGGLKR